jgi:8-oxo-dGTP pyrophosphatase MutT (NUDIX family)
VTNPAEGAHVEVRTSARVILIDPSDRVLLLAARDPADQRVVWFVPGGGVEEGETLEQAAVRELAEEVPMAASVALSGPVWTRHHDFPGPATASARPNGSSSAGSSSPWTRP